MKQCPHCEDEDAHTILETKEERQEAIALDEKARRTVRNGGHQWMFSDRELQLLSGLHQSCKNSE